MRARSVLSVLMAGLLMAGCAAPATDGTAPAASTLGGGKSPASRSLRGASDLSSLASCQVRRDQPDQSKAPFLLIEEGPLPGAGPDRTLTPAETKCVESLRAAGRKAIEGGDIVQGVNRYLSAVDTARALAGEIYLDLAGALDRTAYGPAAVTSYRKAWAALEAVYNRPGVKVEGSGVLVLADIRDALARLGASLPQPTSEPGRIALSNSTRKLKERYFDVPSVTR